MELRLPSILRQGEHLPTLIAPNAAEGYDVYTQPLVISQNTPVADLCYEPGNPKGGPEIRLIAVRPILSIPTATFPTATWYTSWQDSLLHSFLITDLPTEAEHSHSNLAKWWIFCPLLSQYWLLLRVPLSRQNHSTRLSHASENVAKI
jgi:hypothetical protein